MTEPRTSRVLPPVAELGELGPLVVIEGDCAYHGDGRKSLTAFALPGEVDGASYQLAMDVGMRRSGTVIYRPLCEGCRKCQPLRVVVRDFRPSRSQRRVAKLCEGRFHTEVQPPKIDDERLELYRRYQSSQHKEVGQSKDENSYRRFLVDTVTETIEMSWRDETGRLVGVGILDVTPVALSSVYFYWDPDFKAYSLGVYSALAEIAMAQSLGKQFYYLGYLVADAKTMSYKANYEAAEIWDGRSWRKLPSRDVTSPRTLRVLNDAEHSATDADAARFPLELAREVVWLTEETGWDVAESDVDDP